MKWRKHTDVVEAAATAILDALTLGVRNHREIVDAIRRDIKEQQRD